MRELEPKHERCVSYWGRAHVGRLGGGAVALWSYSTPVCFVGPDGLLHRTWSGWSRTTSRHVMEFWRQFCGQGPMPCKKVWCTMPVEALPHGSADDSGLLGLEARP